MQPISIYSINYVSQQSAFWWDTLLVKSEAAKKKALKKRLKSRARNHSSDSENEDLTEGNSSVEEDDFEGQTSSIDKSKKKKGPIKKKK